MTNYNTDFHAWTQEQAKLIRTGQLHQLDLENLAEEIESLGKQERRELRNRLAVLVGHLLKWQFQPAGRGASWRATLREQRREVQRLLKENPSLKPYLDEAIADSYDAALALAIRETGLEQFPEQCPYSVEQIADEGFFPNIDAEGDR
jgi:predicted  nucleic acid-binding Zn-ribbon protein